jgi:hypothetical protein
MVLRRAKIAGLVLLASAAASAQTAQKSTAQQREDVAITVYNQSFGLVREVRNVDLANGRLTLELRDVAAQIQPETVHIKSLTAPGALNVLEQNYRYDLLSPQKLLEKYVGRKVRVHRWNEKTGREDDYDAEVLSVAEGTVLKIGNEITYNWPGRISFPEVPPNLIAKPTLVWLLDSAQPKQKVEVTYLTRALSWHADYVFVLNENDTAGDLTGWVTLVNQSGAQYDNARLKLVAGDVQRVTEYEQQPRGYAKAPASTPAQNFREESFFEYHLYSLQHPTTLLENEQKQVTLLEANGVKIDKRLIFYGAAQYYRGQYGQVVSNQKVGVYLDIQNAENNKLGIPLPKGVVRVYKADKSGMKQFVGEDRIDHTPRDEKIHVKMGEAFDVVGDRKQTDWKSLGSCTTESAWEIHLRNHKDDATQVEVFEPVGGDWEILQSSHPAQKKDAQTFTFKVNVPKRGEVKITYRVRIRWC